MATPELTNLELAICQARDLQQQLDRDRGTVQRLASAIAQYEQAVAAGDMTALRRLAGLEK